MTNRVIVVCADDYGISQGTSAIIRDLLEKRALNATTCLVETEIWPQEARALRALKDRLPNIAVGLHLNLTDPLPNCPDVRARSGLAMFLIRAFLPVRAEAVADIHKNFSAQWALFCDVFGAAPDFVDGHQHVHLFPAAKRALLHLLSEKKFSGWLRQCSSASSRRSLKSLVLTFFSRSFAIAARERGHRLNPAFGGLRDFRDGEDLAAIWRADLAAMPGGGLLMVHPGDLGSPKGADGIDAARRAEARFLGSSGWHALLREANVVLAAVANPW